jgi:hypothetical protein
MRAARSTDLFTASILSFSIIRPLSGLTITFQCPIINQYGQITRYLIFLGDQDGYWRQDTLVEKRAGLESAEPGQKDCN